MVLPAAIIAVLAVLTVGVGRRHGKVTYEPGQSWDRAAEFVRGSIPVISRPPADRVGTKVGGSHGSW